MNKTDVRQSLRSLRVGKILNLTNSDFIPNSSNNKNQYINKYKSVRLQKNKKYIFSSQNNEAKKENFSKGKITEFINEKNNNYFINNKTRSTSFKWNRKINYSKTDDNKKVKLMVIEGNGHQKTYDLEKDNNENYRNLKMYLSSKTINSKNTLHLNEKENNKFFQNLYYIKNPIPLNNEINKYSLNTISLKPQLTTESTKSTFNPNNPKEKDFLRQNRLIKTKLKKDIDKSKVISQSNSEFILDSKIQDKKSYNQLMKIRQKYPFILNQNPLLTKKFIDLPRNIKRTNKKIFDVLKNENDKIFNQYFSIIAKEKFSKKFQNIGNIFDFDKDNSIHQQNNKENLILNNIEFNEGENDDSLINEKIISGYKLLQELARKENKIMKYTKKLSKKALYYKFKKSLIFICSKLKNISIYLNEVIEKYKKPKHCYYFPHSHELFFAIKSRNVKLTEDILNNNKNIVLDYDYFGMTALHLAAKYNFYHIIPKLYEYGSHMDDINYIGDTALLISIKHNYITSTIFLLLCLASPFIKDKRGFNAIHYCKNDFKLNNIMKKICTLHYMSILGKTKNRIEFIQKGFSDYIMGEYSSDLEVDAYNIINEKNEFFKRKNKNN